MIRCPSWPQPPMEDRAVLLNLLSLTWVAMDQASPLREALKEQVLLLATLHNYFHDIFGQLFTFFLRDGICKKNVSFHFFVIFCISLDPIKNNQN